MNTYTVNVIGAGLAGVEAAWQLARQGVHVRLYEMKPQRYSPAHTSPYMAELVCSNSLRSDSLENAVGLLKAEMTHFSSIVMESARACSVPAGGCLAVDREGFSKYITDKISSHPNIEVINEEVTSIGDEITVIATGPLTDGALAEYLAGLLDEESLSFYDAAAPIVEKESIDFSSAYIASRYGKGEAAYINCPMTREEYDAFWQALITAETAHLHGFEENDPKVFEGCMPVEVMASRGHDTLLFGPMKPVGLPDPKTGRDPYAVVQLRQDNKSGSMYNIVGFQTHLTFGEQRRVFGMIPALKNANFLRYGVMHRNTFINSPKLLNCFYQLKKAPHIFFAGQMTGVEGYLESASSGLFAGINAGRLARGLDFIRLDSDTAIGALANYVSDESVTKFQPMNVNFGIIKPLEKRVKGGKSARNSALSERALEIVEAVAKEYFNEIDN
ncbi:MAG: methylenetetrahydrofolate--tRNA-(uracil(54)-C(5))-methyltransferase (FADH(2)-oxidizing) TrmFO [Clostridia bacterium]|nr:methylenetetrahydrofolate--tRNA-(uracil(54)-C(5))-methyltransferase (FADH(2)-oxidizing) TrmFO [Clostridia bacterium]